jgi:hypothetical protein
MITIAHTIPAHDIIHGKIKNFRYPHDTKNTGDRTREKKASQSHRGAWRDAPPSFEPPDSIIPGNAEVQCFQQGQDFTLSACVPYYSNQRDQSLYGRSPWEKTETPAEEPGTARRLRA